MDQYSSIIKIIECPRDAMQGFEHFIPTETKINYLNLLLKAGFDTLDFGSFVSPKHIPQMRDTALVLEKLNLSASKTKLLAIIANYRGAEDACRFEQIKYIGFPLSASETFQKKNTNQSIEQAFESLEEINELCVKNNKTLVVYISMGFGNPYGDVYNSELIFNLVEKLKLLKIKIISFADTVGLAKPDEIFNLYTSIVPQFTEIEFGVHLHSSSNNIYEKIEAAYNAGCKRFDGALKGFGGCPMAEDELIGNIPTELIIDFFEKKEIDLKINKVVLNDALIQVDKVFI